jgi:hypothetical protein
MLRCISYIQVYNWGTLLVTHLVEVPRYKLEGWGVRFPMVSLEFYIDVLLLAVLWFWGRLSLQQK